jgi:putative oxidoreductase
MNSLMQKAEVAYGWFVKAANSLQSPFLLTIRLYWGWQFLESGIGKFNHIEKVIGFFTDLGIPAPTLNAYFNASLETVGGLLLILGLASRLIAVPLLINMIVAYITADKEALTSFFSESGKFFGADPFPFLLVSLLILIFGPGKLALDTLVAVWWKKRSSASASMAAH